MEMNSVYSSIIITKLLKASHEIRPGYLFGHSRVTYDWISILLSKKAGLGNHTHNHGLWGYTIALDTCVRPINDSFIFRNWCSYFV